MPLLFDPQGFPVVNAIISGVVPGGGGLNADAVLVPTSSVDSPAAAAALTAKGGAHDYWLGTSLDMSAIPALMIDAFFAWHAGAVASAHLLYVFWSDVPVVALTEKTKYEAFAIVPGTGSGADDGVGGTRLLLNRKGKYATLFILNECAVAIDITVNAYALGAPVQEYDSTKTGTISGNATAPLTINSNAIFKCDLQTGFRYAGRVLGGDGINIRTDGEVVTTTTGLTFFDGDTFGPFIATVNTGGIQAIKRTANTSDATVEIVTLDNQGK